MAKLASPAALLELVGPFQKCKKRCTSYKSRPTYSFDSRMHLTALDGALPWETWADRKRRGERERREGRQMIMERLELAKQDLTVGDHLTEIVKQANYVGRVMDRETQDWSNKLARRGVALTPNVSDLLPQIDGHFITPEPTHRYYRTTVPHVYRAVKARNQSLRETPGGYTHFAELVQEARAARREDVRKRGQGVSTQLGVPLLTKFHRTHYDDTEHVLEHCEPKVKFKLPVHPVKAAKDWRRVTMNKRKEVYDDDWTAMMNHTQRMLSRMRAHKNFDPKRHHLRCFIDIDHGKPRPLREARDKSHSADTGQDNLILNMMTKANDSSCRNLLDALGDSPRPRYKKRTSAPLASSGNKGSNWSAKSGSKASNVSCRSRSKPSNVSGRAGSKGGQWLASKDRPAGDGDSRTSMSRLLLDAFHANIRRQLAALERTQPHYQLTASSGSQSDSLSGSRSGSQSGLQSRSLSDSQSGLQSRSLSDSQSGLQSHSQSDSQSGLQLSSQFGSQSGSQSDSQSAAADALTSSTYVSVDQSSTTQTDGSQAVSQKTDSSESDRARSHPCHEKTYQPSLAEKTDQLDHAKKTDRPLKPDKAAVVSDLLLNAFINAVCDSLRELHSRPDASFHDTDDLLEAAMNIATDQKLFSALFASVSLSPRSQTATSSTSQEGEANASRQQFLSELSCETTTGRDSSSESEQASGCSNAAMERADSGDSGGTGHESQTRKRPGQLRRSCSPGSDGSSVETSASELSVSDDVVPGGVQDEAFSPRWEVSNSYSAPALHSGARHGPSTLGLDASLCDRESGEASGSDSEARSRSSSVSWGSASSVGSQGSGGGAPDDPHAMPVDGQYLKQRASEEGLPSQNVWTK